MASSWSGVNVRKSTTTSNSRPSRAAAVASLSRMSAVTTSAPGAGSWVLLAPRLSSVTANPSATAARAHAVLMTPVPPMNRTVGEELAMDMGQP